jgi:hypothetical protein
VDINEAIAILPPLLGNLQPVTQNLSDPRTRLDRFFPSLARAARIVAPAAQANADLFVNLDTTFTALSAVARPFIQQTIAESPPTLDTAITNFPQQRPFLLNTAAFMHELQPGVAALPSTMPILADALQAGIPALKASPPFNAQLARLFVAVSRFANDPVVPNGVRRLNDTVTILNGPLAFITPAQTTCNYITLWFRNIGSLLSEGDVNGTWQRFIIIPTPQGPNSESGPSSAPANGPGVDNHLHANNYPNTAAPGQDPKECEAGNEPFIVGKTVIGNVPGNQGTQTSGQVGGQ